MTNTKDRNDCWLGMGAAQLVMECQDLCKQRDELLAALEEALPMVPCGSFDDYHLGLMATDRHMTVQMILRLRKLIASVKGE